jgi:predicted nuclease with TOPRIM domain
VAILQTELDTSRTTNDSLEKENTRLHKKIKKNVLKQEKSTSKISKLEKDLIEYQRLNELVKNENNVRYLCNLNCYSSQNYVF